MDEGIPANQLYLNNLVLARKPFRRIGTLADLENAISITAGGSVTDDGILTNQCISTTLV